MLVTLVSVSVSVLVFVLAVVVVSVVAVEAAAAAAAIVAATSPPHMVSWYAYTSCSPWIKVQRSSLIRRKHEYMQLP